jgi:hypothetical protein
LIWLRIKNDERLARKIDIHEDDLIIFGG